MHLLGIADCKILADLYLGYEISMVNSMRRLTFVSLTLLLAGCEPATVTEARDQLGRGGERLVDFLIPVVSDTFRMQTLLESASVDTTANGLLAISIDTKSLGVTIAASLPPVGVGDTISILDATEVIRAEIDFGDLEDAMRASTINQGLLDMLVTNLSSASVVLIDFNLGLVTMVGDSVPTDGSGNPIYEVDSLGAPILVPIADVGNTFTIADSTTSPFAAANGPYLDRLVHILLDGDRAAIVVRADATVESGQIQSGDQISFDLDLTAVLDFTIPDTGVVFQRNITQDGLSLSPEDADLMADRIVTAELVTEVTNRTPFGVEIDIAFVSGDMGAADPFAEPGRVLLSTITVDTTQVDGEGRVMQPSTTTVRIALTGQELRELLEDRFTAGLRVRMRASASGGLRGAIQAIDDIIIDAQGRFTIRAGNSQ